MRGLRSLRRLGALSGRKVVHIRSPRVKRVERKEVRVEVKEDAERW